MSFRNKCKQSIRKLMQGRNGADELSFTLLIAALIFTLLSSMCGNQSNRRSLTVREAILEGLGACSDCNPPSPSDAEALIDAEDAAASGETPAE